MLFTTEGGLLAAGSRVTETAPGQLRASGKLLRCDSEFVGVHVGENGRRLVAIRPIPRGTRVGVLDERGTSLTTKALAERLQDWQLGGDDVALVIGGPDGLDPAFRQAAHERIRLSDLTLPHAFARVLLIEQLYRAWSVNANHPYHRE